MDLKAGAYTMLKDHAKAKAWLLPEMSRITSFSSVMMNQDFFLEKESTTEHVQ